jgi:hypothetical protein
MIRSGLALLVFLSFTANGCGGGSTPKPDLQPPDFSSSCTGGPVPGAADKHCQGMLLVSVNPTLCTQSPDGGSGDDADGGDTMEYGATMYGTMGMDDDCKYDVSYSVPQICENAGTTFTVKATYAVGNAPVTGAMTRAEVFLNDTHPAPNSGVMTTESPIGTYEIGPIVFDASGMWTVRFHFFEGCIDSPASPHGHAAFYINVP